LNLKEQNHIGLYLMVSCVQNGSQAWRLIIEIDSLILGLFVMKYGAFSSHNIHYCRQQIWPFDTYNRDQRQQINITRISLLDWINRVK
jgi:hypothetical protein